MVQIFILLNGLKDKKRRDIIQEITKVHFLT